MEIEFDVLRLFGAICKFFEKNIDMQNHVTTSYFEKTWKILL